MPYGVGLNLPGYFHYMSHGNPVHRFLGYLTAQGTRGCIGDIGASGTDSHRRSNAGLNVGED